MLDDAAANAAPGQIRRQLRARERMLSAATVIVDKMIQPNLREIASLQ
jgi:hypothetical protein